MAILKEARQIIDLHFSCKEFALRNNLRLRLSEETSYKIMEELGLNVNIANS